MIKKLLLIAALLLPMFASAQTVKIGLVDVNAVMGALPDTKEAQEKINEVSKKYDDAYTKLGEEMKRLMDELQNMKEDELPAIRERKTRDFQEQQQKMQTFEQTAMQDLQKLQQDLMTPIMTKIKGAIESVGREESYTLVMDNNPQIIQYYGAPAEDITAKVKSKLGIQ